MVYGGFSTDWFSPPYFVLHTLYFPGMTIDALIMLSGAFVAVLPFLGFPNSWDSYLFVIAGAFTIALGIVVRRRLGRSEKKTDTSAQFAESAPRHDENQLAQ